MSIVSTARALVAAAAPEARRVAGRPGVLTDAHGRVHNYLRISLTERCNLRCQYCMPLEGVTLTPNDKLLTAAEIERIAGVFAREGVNKVRFTGGEPLVRADALDVIERVGRLDGIGDMGITTNGIVLERHLDALWSAGVRTVNISLDTMSPRKFQFITRRNGHERVLRAIDASVAAGMRTKVNCVVKRDMNDDELADFVEFTRERPVDVRFIEFMPFDANRWSGRGMVSYIEMVERIRERFKLQRLPDQPNDTSKAWKVDGFAGQVGFITSMSEHFCGSCNRVRLMADGNLKVCLFGNEEVNLRGMVRDNEVTDKDIAAVIDSAINRKAPRHAGMFDLSKLKNRAMVAIGG